MSRSTGGRPGRYTAVTLSYLRAPVRGQPSGGATPPAVARLAQRQAELKQQLHQVKWYVLGCYTAWQHCSCEVRTYNRCQHSTVQQITRTASYKTVLTTDKAAHSIAHTPTPTPPPQLTRLAHTWRLRGQARVVQHALHARHVVLHLGCLRDQSVHDLRGSKPLSGALGWGLGKGCKCGGPLPL